MKSVAELAGKRLRRATLPGIPHEWPLPDTLIGIEVEVESKEGVRLPEDLTLWATHNDGSLQNGKEFVLANPMKGSVLRGAINELMQGNTFTRTMTGSTHVHIDMLEEQDTPDVLRTLVLMVYILEPLLYAVGDRGREWCGFAGKLMSGPDEILTTVMDNDVSPDRFYQTYSRGSSKFGRYYGMNLAALTDYGSLEFRYFPTATKEEELVNWVELVQTFKRTARIVGNISTLDAIIEDEASFNTFLNTYFGKWSHLFAQLGSYNQMRNDYRKAGITCQLRSVVAPKEVFNPTLVFAGDKFKKLVKYVVAEVNNYTATLVRVGTPLPDPEYGSIIVTNGQVFVTLLESSPLYRNAGYPQWVDVRNLADYHNLNVVAEDSVLVSALQGVIDAYGSLLAGRAHSIIDALIELRAEHEADDRLVSELEPVPVQWEAEVVSAVTAAGADTAQYVFSATQPPQGGVR